MVYKKNQDKLQLNDFSYCISELQSYNSDWGCKLTQKKNTIIIYNKNKIKYMLSFIMISIKPCNWSILKLILY